jgi:hypothetical protein
LIFPAGTEIAFEILNALKYSKFVNIFGGTSADDHSEFVYKNLIKGFPYIGEDGFLEYLNAVIQAHQIDCIYPAHDSASVFFSEHLDEIHAQVIITDPETTAICRSKKATYQYFAGESFVPRFYETPGDIQQYPVFVKPAVGQGSVGAKMVENAQELALALAEDPTLVICEYLPGMEYTVDCFTDKNGKLLVSKIRDRQRIKTGISVRSREYQPDQAVVTMAQTINDRLHFKGAWFFQVKRNASGDYRLMEISPRIPGTMGLSRNLGINFPMLTLFVFWDYDVSVIDNGYDIMLDRAFYSAYKLDYQYEHVYLDFDDTVTLNGAVNPDVMRFIYQARNQGKQIHLLSKHAGDIHQDLQKCCISEALFQDITVLSAEDEKINYITEKSAIFIDDSFAERKKVHDNRGIAVFDVDMIESLIDWRV